jgi:hypothetical protein
VYETVSVPARFNGPETSGHGGYSSGIFASFLEGPVEVTLRSPVPLDTPLEIIRDGEGSIRVLGGELLVAEVRAAPQLDLEVPEPVGVADAQRARERYRGAADGLFGRCFVCGRGRDDALGVFAGAVDGRDLVASSWTPPDWTADGSGAVRAELVWSVLDCPTYFAVYPGDELPVSFLGRLAVRLEAPVAAGEEHVVISWPIGVDGRKRHAGAALLSADGAALAVARALMIEPREQLIP